MKYLLLLLLSLGLKAELDLTIPEQPAVYIPDKKFLLKWGDYNEPPTKNQIIFFWTINALDVYTTYEGLKNPNISEVNPLLGKKPNLDNLLIQKAIVAGFISKNSNKNYITFLNVGLTLVVINNYNIAK
jgi:hypothetical protein